ncbi:hypothetical protein SEA_MAGRITTE_199 [Microbacterium phage Magritte]|nr:hypothetical protein SEA_MAGRITTE_199 [Microbacterium phage Magritte]
MSRHVRVSTSVLRFTQPSVTQKIVDIDAQPRYYGVLTITYSRWAHDIFWQMNFTSWRPEAVPYAQI